MKLYTIGHSNHSIETFIGLLKQHKITAVADVRSHPYSKYLPHFNRNQLQEKLKETGIKYVFLGKQLGARPSNINCYIEGKALYEKIAQTDSFSEGIERILNGSNKYKISLMCAEQDPIVCHRAILICQHLQQSKLDIYHIKKNGSLESHQDLETRLLKVHNLIDNSSSKTVIQLNLFDDFNYSLATPIESREDLIKKAYTLQSDRIAYVDKQHNYDNEESED